MRLFLGCILALTLWNAPCTSAQTNTTRTDILIADFEGTRYGSWTATGDAFGPGPARGTLPGQMTVSGYLGQGLVNSFYRGDETTGTLTSPPFGVERPNLNFLIGGGGYPGETCINLMIDGKTVRSATGPNREPGGSERLRWHTFAIREFLGSRWYSRSSIGAPGVGATSTLTRSSRVTGPGKRALPTASCPSHIVTFTCPSAPARRSRG